MSRPPNPWLAVALVVSLGCLAFAPALGNQFPLDDSLAQHTTSQHDVDPIIAEWHGPWHYFGHNYWAGENRASRLYRPVTIWSYAWTYQLVSKPFLPIQWEAFPHHLINLLINAWAVYLVVWMMTALGICRVGSLLVAAMFGVHALHSEVVAGIVGRAELLSFCFGVVALQAWVRAEAHQGERWRSTLWCVVAGVAVFVALGAKESAIAWLPLLPCFLLARAWLADRGGIGAVTQNKLGLAAVLVVPLIVFLGLRSAALGEDELTVFYTANPLYHESVTVRLLTAIKLWGYALYKCFAPFSLACLYGLHAVTLVDSPTDPGFLAALTALLAWSIAGLYRPARHPRLFLSVALFFGFSVLTSNVPFAIGTIFGERLYFIPSLGVCMLPALLLPRLSRTGRRLLLGLCWVWIVTNIGVDLQRSSVWKDNTTLMIHDAEQQPQCASLRAKAAGMYHWLSRTSGDEGENDEGENPDRRRFRALAWEHLRAAIDIDPEYVNARLTLATFHRHDGDHELANRVLRAALKMQRLPISGLEGSLRGELGLGLIELGQREAGVAELRRAVARKPRVVQWQLALLEYGMGVLAPSQAQQLLVGALEQFPRDLRLKLFEADFIFTYAEITRANAEQAVQGLKMVYRHLSAEATDAKMFAKGYLQLGQFQRGLGRYDEARRNFAKVLRHDQSTAEFKVVARAEMQKLDQQRQPPPQQQQQRQQGAGK